VDAGADAADALAVAICHAHRHRATARPASRPGRSRDRQAGKGDWSTRSTTDSAVIDVGGVGYLVSARPHACAILPAGAAVSTLLSRRMVREDAIRSTASSKRPSATGSAC
jgi:hypothetical protein